MDAPHRAFDFVFLDLDCHAVRQLVTEQPEQLFAQELGSHEALAAVGDRILVEHRFADRQIAARNCQQAIDVVSLLGGDRHDLGERVEFAHLGDEGQQSGLVLEPVGLVDHQHDRRAGRQQRDHGAIGITQSPRLDQQEHQVDVGQRLCHGAVHHAIEGAAMLALETGRIDEHELGVRFRQHGVDPVAGGLRLARDDADLLPHQSVRQRRLADIGASDDRHQSAAKAISRIGRIVAHRRCNSSRQAFAACCSAPRRLLPCPILLICGLSTTQRTSNSWACASPRTSTSS